MAIRHVVAVLLGLAVLGSCQNALPRLIGTTPLSAAAFVEAFIDQGDETTFIGDRYSLYVSTFHPLNPAPDGKFMMRGLGSNFQNISGWELVEIPGNSAWPNNPDEVPFEVFNTTALVWTSGFLVPQKTHGRLQLYDTSKNPLEEPINLAQKNTGNNWSYHRVIWKDMDFDGDLDALTARFHKTIISTNRHLVWFENPGIPIQNLTSEGWDEHVIHQGGADVHFRMATLPYNGNQTDCMISAEFWGEVLNIYCSRSGNWSDWNSVVKIKVDDTMGQTFDVYYHDFNQDGRSDILISAYNHTLGNVFVYEVPDDLAFGTFTKHTIADGFKANPVMGGQSMTPGSPKPFYPTKAYADTVLPDKKHRKPYILLSGDDDGKHYILEPANDDRDDWTYNKHVLVDTEKTTSGKFAVADFDGDGYTDIVAAGYTAGMLYAFTYAPEQ